MEELFRFLPVRLINLGDMRTEKDENILKFEIESKKLLQGALSKLL